MDVEALPLEDYSRNSNSENNIDAVSTEYTKKPISEMGMEAFPLEEDNETLNSKKI